VFGTDEIVEYTVTNALQLTDSVHKGLAYKPVFPMSRTSQDYLDRHPLFHSKDLDETRAIMGSHWAEHKVNVTEGTTFETTVNHAAIGPARMTYVRCPTSLEVSSSPLRDSYIIYLMKAGEAKHVLDGRLSVATQHRAVVQCPGQQVEMSTTAARCLALDFPREVVERGFASRNYSLPYFHRLGHTVDLESPSGLALCRWTDWTASELNRAASTSVLTSAADLIAQSLLNLFLDSVGTSVPLNPGKDGQLGRVRFIDLEHWIRANLEMPLTVETLAEFAGVSTRAVQSAFRQYRGCSPSQFLCRVRLEEVRRQLESPQPGASVTQIAMNHGFFHLGRFSKVYREQFGEKPNDTLRKAMGND
jgi:AraC-like DNA-binding protein